MINTETKANLLRLRRMVESTSGFSLSRRTTELYQFGPFQSPSKGEGLEFVDSRTYQPGDDVRQINWKAFARKAGPPEVMQFQRERQIAIAVVCNTGASMQYGTQQLNLAELAAVLTGSILRTAAQTGATGRFIGYDDDGEVDYSLAVSQVDTSQILDRAMVKAMQCGNNPVVSDGGGLARALKRLPTQPGLVFVISDFRRINQADHDALHRAIRRQNEIICIRVTDLRERELPYTPLHRWLPIPAVYDVRDDAGNRRTVLATKAECRKYAQAFNERQARIAAELAEQKCCYTSFDTGDSKQDRRRKLVRLLTGPRKPGLILLDSKTTKGGTL